MIKETEKRVDESVDKTPAATSEQPLVLPGAEDKEVTQPQAKTPPAKPESTQVTVAPHLSDLVTGAMETPEDETAARRRHNLNEVVHQVLILGLTLSTALIVIGLILDLVRHRTVPASVPTFREVFHLTTALRPSGFLTLGLLVLVATPILRVIGSTFAFIYERDWRYAAITFLVLVIVALSVILGQG